MRCVFLFLVFALISTQAFAISARTEAREEAKQKRELAIKQEQQNNDNIEITAKNSQEINQKLQNLDVKLQKIIEQNAITNVLIRELIKQNGE